MNFKEFYIFENYTIGDKITIRDIMGNITADEQITEYGAKNFDIPLTIIEKPTKELTSFGGNDLLNIFNKHAKSYQKKYVRDFIKQIKDGKDVKPIIVDENKVVDGNHRAIAYLLSNIDKIKAIDLQELSRIK